MSRPARRPPLAVRAAIGLCGLGVGMATAALMLSDRAPGVLRRLFGEFAVHLSARIDSGQRDRLVDLASDPRLPARDQIVHIVLWGVVMTLVGLTVWSLRWLLPAALLVGAASVAIELLQGRLTHTRGVEATDIAANLVGITAGTAVALGIYALWSAIAAILRPRP